MKEGIRRPKRQCYDVKVNNMRRRLVAMNQDELRPEYDLSQLKGGVRGKYYQQATAGTNLVLIEPDLAQAFPGEESVNRALRLLVSVAHAATSGSRRAQPRKKRPKTVPGRRGRQLGIP
jgi:hypothetical protein